MPHPAADCAVLPAASRSAFSSTMTSVHPSRGEMISNRRPHNPRPDDHYGCHATHYRRGFLLDFSCNKRHSTPVVPFRLIPQPGIPIADQVVFAAKKPCSAASSARAMPSLGARARPRHENPRQYRAEGDRAAHRRRPARGAPRHRHRGRAAARGTAGRGRLLVRDVEQLTCRRCSSASRRRTAGIARRMLAWPLQRRTEDDPYGESDQVYRRNTALRDVTFEVPDGSIFAWSDPTARAKAALSKSP